MKVISLNGTWQLAYGLQRPGGPQTPAQLEGADWSTIPAVVPGNVELDLMRAGVLPELSYANNIYLLRKYEGYQWWYRRTFATPQSADGDRVALVFDGLDCVAGVFVNGQLIGEPRNMLIPQRFDVTDALRTDGKENEFVVRIDSAVLAGREHQPAPVEGAIGMNWESLWIRKAPHMYGWDIMPRVVSAGLWRGVRLELVPPTRWGDIYVATASTDREKASAAVIVDSHIVTDCFDIDAWQVRISLSLDGQAAHNATHAVIGTHLRTRFTVADARLWWPRGYGAQPLYDLKLDLLDADGNVLATHTQRIGLRTIKLLRTDITTPENPGQFVFVVNGEKVFAKGTNWVPLDALHSRDHEHLATAFDMIVDLNCNMIRCWGGNVYEDHDFFDLCDAHGVMVWQDFALACALYPQTDEFADMIRREAEVIVRKLRQHPSLALWAGNNEIDVFYHGGWLASAASDPNKDRLSRQVLPDVMRQLDPFRDYLPSSPYVSPAAYATGNPYAVMPEDHLWGPRDDFKGAYYTKSHCHFVSEIGYHGCPNRESLEKMMAPEALWPWQDNEQWLTHAVRPHRNMTNYNARIALMAKQAAVLFKQAPENLDDFILASQISQAEAKKFFIERFRSGKWQRTGILWWNLRDGWPEISDAIVDYYGGKKLAYDYIKQVQADVCAMCGEAEEGMHPLVIVNDTLCEASGHLTVRDADSGQVLFGTEYRIEANGRLTAGSVPAAPNATMWLLEWTADGRSFQSHYLAGPRPFMLEDYKRWLGIMGLKGQPKHRS
ncbi:MAG: glycoside hydrolase family 2 [Kiritimatiellaeota bacterium]|nr:glycoside hydrolase family 2 [Kiritimatiellota bacterium]